MKCDRCGTHIPEGKVYCPRCGSPVQIVPDYNVVDEDIIPSMLAEKKQKKKHYRERKIIIFILIFTAAAAALLFAAGKYMNADATLLKKAKAAYADEKYADALIIFERLLESDPDNGEVLLGAGKAACRTGDPETGRTDLLAAFDAGAIDEEAAGMLLELLYSRSDYDGMQNIIEKCTKNGKSYAVLSSYVTAAPVFSEDPGTYKKDMEVALTCDGAASIRYTTDGTDPAALSGLIYSGPLRLSDGTTRLRACGISADGKAGPVAEAAYTISYPVPSDPLVTPDSGTYGDDVLVTITGDDGASIYYTWDNTIPGAGSAKYTGPLEIPYGNNVLSVLCISEDGISSGVVRKNYIKLQS